MGVIEFSQDVQIAYPYNMPKKKVSYQSAGGVQTMVIGFCGTGKVGQPLLEDAAYGLRLSQNKRLRLKGTSLHMDEHEVSPPYALADESQKERKRKFENLESLGNRQLSEEVRD